ncbi:2-hydroxyacid dehydrogenase [Kitasatospora atroaurantiaca]|uniref:Phosphoglycerate dehydrogenase-like enzyme n=1 Tax=Kitasatospora atroaurantiaca TaxID=285545 RepID=A0A561F1D6_9ACTN|nr:2-hydroxyacid dehydrogenase [Kitasatospora atroaurantiaca]TWE21632.1 phosphoglycerate dehydrogenase-like enzyme [Kitasatospora atroaurantiaca]
MTPTSAAPGGPTVRILLPYPTSQLGGLPELPAALWDGWGEAPPERVLGEVEFFVIPYTYTSAALPLLRRMPRLRVVQSLSAGVEEILPVLPPGVTLCNARGVHDASTAELAVTLVLSALRGVPVFVRAQDAQVWSPGSFASLADRTVLIIGYGSIGAAVEDRLAPFECEVLRVARTARAAFRGPVHSLAELPALLPRSDVVVLTLPLTDETRGLVDAGFLASMKDGALLVNVARGPVVDTDALLVELQRGRLAAALDVTDPEPLPAGHPLWQAPNTLISPHTGGNSSAFLPRALRLIRTQLDRFLAGEPLENVVVPPGA